MIATLRESKAHLSELVNRAASGEEVLITVRGRPMARLVAESPSQMTGWADELRTIQQKYPCAQVDTVQDSVLDDLREERGR